MKTLDMIAREHDVSIDVVKEFNGQASRISTNWDDMWVVEDPYRRGMYGCTHDRFSHSIGAGDTRWEAVEDAVVRMLKGEMMYFGKQRTPRYGQA